jgi:hypothetical protein
LRYGQGKASDAESYILREHELSPGGESRLALARLYVEKKELDQAEKAISDAEGEAPYTRGLIHLHRKRHEEAARPGRLFWRGNRITPTRILCRSGLQRLEATGQDDHPF